MDMHAVRRHNLRTLIAQTGDGSVASFAREFGFTEARLSQLLSRTFRAGKNFGEKMARKIEHECDLPILILDRIPDDPSQVERETGYQPSDFGSKVIHLGPNLSVRDIEIFELRAGLGEQGFEAVPEMYRSEYAKIGIRRQWIHENNIDPAKLIATKVRGDGMSPSLFDGDFVGIDLDQVEPIDGAVFVLIYEFDVLIRRLMRDGGQWWLTADNPDQRRFARKVFHEDAITIVGRVVHRETSKI